MRSPPYQAPPDARLGIEIQSDKTGRIMLGMEKEKDRYHWSVKLNGDSKWQRVVLSPSDFKNRNGETLNDWNGVDIVITPIGASEWEHLKMRNLTWITNGKMGDNLQ